MRAAAGAHQRKSHLSRRLRLPDRPVAALRTTAQRFRNSEERAKYQRTIGQTLFQLHNPLLLGSWRYVTLKNSGVFQCDQFFEIQILEAMLSHLFDELRRNALYLRTNYVVAVQLAQSCRLQPLHEFGC